ncbi:winged helix-turn-helix transcriptional regulator [Paenibacillus sp. 8b26]|uniref:winged helix-turn-helix transcriptional regulator n=1 Tax=Paenibacillus sp. 8b26 TaxID=3424133 RepID=UPI003D65CFCE
MVTLPLLKVYVKVLSEALKELVTDSLVERTVYPEIPPKVCYKIMEYGMTLSSIFEVLHEWGKEHNNRSN